MNLKNMTTRPTELHVTLLHTRQSRDVSRSALDVNKVREFRDAIRHGGRMIRLPIGLLNWEISVNDGNGLSHLWLGQRLVAVAGIATQASEAGALWQFLCDLSEDQSGREVFGPHKSPPPIPTCVPWLGILFAPELRRPAKQADRLILEALHWFLGWAVVEHARSLQAFEQTEQPIGH